MTARMAPTASEPSDLVVVIVNYRTGPLVVNCLASLAPEVAEHPGVRVLVVDNASPDGSDVLVATDIAERGWESWASVHRSDVNGGFAYANNLAIRMVLSQCRSACQAERALLWMLNPDTLVRPGAVGAILNFARRHPRAGAIGTAIEDDAGAPWPFAFRFHSLAGELESAFRIGIVTRLLGRYALARRMAGRAERVDWVSGASVILRGAVFLTAGWFDEDFFLYFEETDFFHRVAAAGWERWYCPSARVQHISGQSTGLTARDAAQRRIPPYWFHSRRRYLVKNHGRLYAIAADFITLAGLALWRVRCAATRQPHDGSPYFLRDFVRHSAIVRRDIGANPGLNAARAARIVQGPVPPAQAIARIAQSA